MQLLGTITATSAASLTNGTTAVTFASLAGRRLLLQPDAACNINDVAASGTTITTTGTIRLEAFEKFEITMPNGSGYLAVIPPSGTVNLLVWAI